MSNFDNQDEENIETDSDTYFTYYPWVIGIIGFILIIGFSYVFLKRYILCQKKHFDQCSLQKFLYNPTNDFYSGLGHYSYKYNARSSGLERKKN